MDILILATLYCILYTYTNVKIPILSVMKKPFNICCEDQEICIKMNDNVDRYHAVVNATLCNINHISVLHTLNISSYSGRSTYRQM